MLVGYLPCCALGLGCTKLGRAYRRLGDCSAHWQCRRSTAGDSETEGLYRVQWGVFLVSYCAVTMTSSTLSAGLG